MKALIVAGNRGTRLAPFTKVLPKPLIPLGDYPVLEIILCQLREAGFAEITLVVNYLAELFEAYFGSGERLGIDIRYLREETPLGTAGSLDALRSVDEPLLVMSADVLTDLDFQALYLAHADREAVLTMALYAREYKVEFGVIDTDANGRVTRCREKPTLSFLVDTGVYVVSPAVFRHIPCNQYCDMPDVIDLLNRGGLPIYGYPFSGQWLDLSKADNFDRVVAQFQYLSAVAETQVPLEAYVRFLSSIQVEA